MFDTHCHLSEPPFASNLAETFQAARAAGVSRFLCIGTTANDWQAVSTIAMLNAAVTPAFGIHPLFKPPAADRTLTALDHYLQKHPDAAVGEVGLDFYERPDSAEQNRQITMFVRHLILAAQYSRPLVIHQRKAQDHCLRLLRENHFSCGGFVHGFSGSMEQAKQWLDMGFVIGIGTVLLRAHSRLREVLRALPQAAWVLESDAPFMCAHNHPRIIAEIARLAAVIRSEPLTEIAAYTTENALRLLKQAS